MKHLLLGSAALVLVAGGSQPSPASCHVQGGAKATKKQPLGGPHARTIGHEILEVLARPASRPRCPTTSPAR